MAAGMTFRPQLLAVALSLGVLAANTPLVSMTEAQRYWPQWRGPAATGVAPEADPPTEWSEDLNVRWKVLLPGHGHSSPIVWEDTVFVLTAVPVDTPGDSSQSPVGWFRRGCVIAPRSRSSSI